jgi:hypothetical protein
MTHFCSYMTFCKLAGLSEAACASDPLAEAGGLPPIDSLDLWPMLSGANMTSPRTEVPISPNALLQVRARSSADVGNAPRLTASLNIATGQAAERKHRLRTFPTPPHYPLPGC